MSLLCIYALHIHEILEVQTVPDGHLGEFVLGNESGINHLSFRGVFCCGELIKICHRGHKKTKMPITPDIPPPAADMLSLLALKVRDSPSGADYSSIRTHTLS